jgi:hypothetical protein
VITGLITQKCLTELVDFASALKHGEGRQDIWVSVCRRWPLQDYRSVDGIEFSIYGDTHDTANPSLIITSGSFEFLVYIPADEVGMISGGVFWLKDGATVILSDALNLLNLDQGSLIHFNARGRDV